MLYVFEKNLRNPVGKLLKHHSKLTRISGTLNKILMNMQRQKRKRSTKIEKGPRDFRKRVRGSKRNFFCETSIRKDRIGLYLLLDL